MLLRRQLRSGSSLYEAYIGSIDAATVRGQIRPKIRRAHSRAGLSFYLPDVR